MRELAIDITSKHYGNDSPVLKGLRFEVTAGEVVALTGPSGVGKTTLLRLLAGLDADYRGAIRVGGVALEAANPSVGMVFQEPRLMPWLTVRENIELVLQGAASDQHAITDVLEAVGLGDRSELWPGQLSGGMQRRAALARAFAVRPELLLLDEPFVSLDKPTAHQLRELLRKLWERLRSTVVLVSHDLDDALALADRIVFLSAPPARVLLEQRLGAPSSATPTASRRALADKLLATHPALLAGELDLAPKDRNPDSARERVQ